MIIPQSLFAHCHDGYLLIICPIPETFFKVLGMGTLTRQALHPSSSCADVNCGFTLGLADVAGCFDKRIRS